MFDDNMLSKTSIYNLLLNDIFKKYINKLERNKHQFCQIKLIKCLYTIFLIVIFLVT